tara:strand:+ start:288 stop:2234 length:1947 start_codon:yes stop_codon:yes gene_type:complete
MDPITQQLALASAGAATGDPVYVDDVFSTHLYEGNSSTRTITNGIDLSGEGGLTWIKCRTISDLHYLYDTERGATKSLHSEATYTEQTRTNTLTSFNSNGFSLGTDGDTNFNGRDYVSWTFRKAPGFFDVVTYTGNGTAGRQISHNLGSVPGCIIIKCTSHSDNWYVHHRSVGATQVTLLNTTNGAYTSDKFNDTLPTSSYFELPADASTNGSGRTFVAYLFAHDDQSFGTDGNEAIIKCGSYTGNGSTSNVVNLGFEPQWLLVKRTDGAGQDWHLFDVMRGMTGGSIARLYPNLAGAEAVGNGYGVQPLPNGFDITASGTDWNGNNYNYIYIAIRRPHKPPENATDVFDVNVETEARTTSGWTSLSGFVTDAFMNSRNLSSEKYTRFSARLTGGRFMYTDSNSSEGTTVYHGYDTNNGIRQGPSTLNSSSDKNIDYHFRRAPGFFDVVTWSGNGSANRAINHNLTVIPELYITKRRTTNENWIVTTDDLITSAEGLFLNTNSAKVTGLSAFNSVSSPTSSVFYVGSDSSINGSSDDYIAYLFASLSGVSKIGTYSGTGNNINVDCGFTNGARFVLVKRIDSSGNWTAWDATRGIVSGDDPFIRLNTTAGEFTSSDFIDPYNLGFTITSSAPGAINTNGGTYLFLAIA